MSPGCEDASQLTVEGVILMALFPPPPMPSAVPPSHRRLQTASRRVGLGFALMGLLGFLPVVTSNLDRLALTAGSSGASLFELIGVSLLGNVLHLGVGVAGLQLAPHAAGARAFLFGGGAALLALSVHAVIVGHHGAVNSLTPHAAGTWLYFAAGAVMIGLGAWATAPRTPVPSVLC